MELKKFKVTDECISCGACVEIALNNFAIGDSGFAYVKKQPEDEHELNLVLEAMEACPVGAIVEMEQPQQEDNGLEPILASSNVKETLDKYPQLKEVLINLSPRFKRLQNPVMYNTLAKFISFADAARVTGVSICEILHVLNKHLGTEKKLHEIMPDCIKSEDQSHTIESDELIWDEPAERYIYNSDTMPELIEKVRNLEPQQAIVMVAVDQPTELIKVAKGLGYKVNIEHGRDWRISIFNPQPQEKTIDRSKFDILDVRYMQHDPFDEIMKKAYQTAEGHGFVLIQRFVPYPIINMLTEMGFEAEVEQVAPDEVKVYFYKKPTETDISTATKKIDVVIQSATPVAYPVIMRLLQSDRLRDIFNIRELKVWDETEKHLAWITNGKADISFSALLTSLKIYRFGIKIPALFVWDNFVLLSRQKNIKSFADLRGQEIHLPLFNEAPPARITRYLIKATGNNPEDYHFVFGKPFGRPEQIYQDFITGKATNVVLREPEASYAVKIMLDRGEQFSEISFNELWNKVNPGFGSFPNAGVVIKEQFLRDHPQEAQIFLDELKATIEWVNANRKEAARLSFDMLRQPMDRVELFLERVNFEYKSGEELIKKIRWYFDILHENGIIDQKVPNDFYDIFRL